MKPEMFQVLLGIPEKAGFTWGEITYEGGYRRFMNIIQCECYIQSQGGAQRWQKSQSQRGSGGGSLSVVNSICSVANNRDCFRVTSQKRKQDTDQFPGRI